MKNDLENSLIGDVFISYDNCLFWAQQPPSGPGPTHL
jgi:hypothetical protein